MNENVLDNFTKIKRSIEAAAKGRSVRIIGVTKTVPAGRIEEAYIAGVNLFGENRIQEALPKIKALGHLKIDWHFIGHLQTNKARDAVGYFSCIHSIDSVKLLQQIEKEAAKLQKKIDVLLEVNLGGEESKHGFPTGKISDGLEAGKQLIWTRIIGFMTIPPFMENAEEVRPHFRRLRELLQQNQQDHPTLMELSMGMSHDYVVAVEEGATMVRIGTALFGERMI